MLLLDVDFLPPEELSRIFSVRQEYQSTLVYLYNNAVIVLPAFEPLQGGIEGQQLALKLVKGTLPACCTVPELSHTVAAVCENYYVGAWFPSTLSVLGAGLCTVYMTSVLNAVMEWFAHVLPGFITLSMLMQCHPGSLCK